MGWGMQSASLSVLLVEDNPGDATLVRYALADSRRPTFHVTHVTTLAEAQRHLAETPADVVLLDLTLPDSSGMETVARVQKMAPFTAIVVLTGLDDPDLADRILEAGAQDYLTKDMEMGGQLQRSIRYALTRRNAQLERQVLLRRLAVEKERLQEELEAARQMQMQLLPSMDLMVRLHARHGLMIQGLLEASSAVGGDVWGCSEIDGERTGVFVFDFSGHGITAALNSFRLHALIEDHAELRVDPARMLRNLSVSLKQLLPRGQYATMFYGVFDAVHERLTWSGAAAPPPILLLKSGAASFLDTQGLPLGVGDGSGYTNRTIDFSTGSSLFLYSDAITDAQLPDGEYFGEDNLMRLVKNVTPSTDALGTLLDAFRDEVPGPLVDDLTAVLVHSVPVDGGGA